MLVNPTINLKVLQCVRIFVDLLKDSESGEIDTSAYDERFMPKIDQNWINDALKPNLRLDFELMVREVIEEEEAAKKIEIFMENYT